MSNEANAISNAAIEGESHPTVERYFDALNTEQHESAAALFAADGVLLPPFEEPIVGREAIALYLATEAAGMRLHPRQSLLEPLDHGNVQYRITGSVETPVFRVNVTWFFIVSPQSDLVSVQVRLLASPQELLNLRR